MLMKAALPKSLCHCRRVPAHHPPGTHTETHTHVKPNFQHSTPGWALCGHEAPAGAGCEEGDEDGATGPSAGTEPGASDQAGAAAPPLPGIPPHGAKRKAAGAGRPTSKQSSTHWQPHHHIPRSARIAVGQHCKALIDAGRLAYLTGRGGMEGVLVAYISPEVSGENKLLLGLRGRDPAL